jgi:uncharacterized protein YbjQ (UPF0145 family)
MGEMLIGHYAFWKTNERGMSSPKKDVTADVQKMKEALARKDAALRKLVDAAEAYSAHAVCGYSHYERDLHAAIDAALKEATP